MIIDLKNKIHSSIYTMGSILSRVCPCFLRESKVEEDVKLSTIDFIKEQNKLDSLSNDEHKVRIFALRNQLEP